MVCCVHDFWEIFRCLTPTSMKSPERHFHGGSASPDCVDVYHELYSWMWHQHCDSPVSHCSDAIIMNAQRIFDGCFMTCSMIVLCLDYGTRNMSLSYLLVSINFNITGYSPFTSSSVNMTCPVCPLNNVTWAFCKNILQSLNVLTQI